MLLVSTGFFIDVSLQLEMYDTSPFTRSPVEVGKYSSDFADSCNNNANLIRIRSSPRKQFLRPRVKGMSR